MTVPRRLRLLVLVPCLLLGLPAAVAGAHDGPHLSDPVAQGTRIVDGEPVAYAYHSDAVADVPDATVVAPVARAELAGVPGATLGTAAAGLEETWCGDTPPALDPGTGTPDDVANAVHPPATPQFKVVYAYASDRTSRFDQLADRLQANVSLLSRFIAGQSGGTKTIRFDMGTSCGAGNVDIQVVRLPRPIAAYGGPNFTQLAADVRAVVASQSGPRDWIVYADAMRQSSVAGTGEFTYGPAAEAPGAASHDAGRLVSVVWGPASLPSSPYADPTTMLHEMGHNLGAVQGGAPHTTGTVGSQVAGHCTDEWDVMCYADGGSDNALTYPCPQQSEAVTETFDCGGDDYFNPAPAAGSWLASHWNVYASAMLGACAGPLEVACGVETPAPPLPVNQTPAAPSGWGAAPYAVTLTGTNATQWQWRVDGGAVRTGAQATVAGGGVHTLETRVGSAGGVWTSWRSELVRLDVTAPTVRLECFRTVVPDFACTASGEDAESGLADLVVSDGRGGWADLLSGQTVLISAPATVTATGTDRVGLVGIAQREIAMPATTTLPSVPPVPAAPLVPPQTRTVPVRVRDRRGRARGRAQLTVTTAGTDRSARLRLGRVKAPAGAYRITACLVQPGRKPRCRTRTAQLRRAGKLPRLAVSAALVRGPVQARVAIARKRGGRYARPLATARASIV